MILLTRFKIINRNFQMQRTAEIEAHEQKLEEDREDLIELRTQIDKIQFLKSEFDQQKQQIHSLNHAIDELKSQNEDLKSLTCKLEKGSKDNDDCMITHSQEKQFGPVLSEDPDLEQHNQTIGYNTRNKDKSLNKVRSRGRNQLLQRDREVKSARNKTMNRFSRNNQHCPQSNGFYQYGSVSHRSGDIQPNAGQTPKRQTSPQFNKLIRTTRDSLGFQPYQSSTKQNLIQNFVSDLKFELQEKDSLMHEKIGIINRLQKELISCHSENKKLAQTQDQLNRTTEVLSRENSCLKVELRRQRQLQHEYDRNQAYQQSLKRRWASEEEEEFQKMDMIYRRFTAIVENREFSM